MVVERSPTLTTQTSKIDIEQILLRPQIATSSIDISPCAEIPLLRDGETADGGMVHDFGSAAVVGPDVLAAESATVAVAAVIEANFDR